MSFKNPTHSAGTAFLEMLGIGVAHTRDVKTEKKSKIYPFSSTRQDTRLARQTARKVKS
jgi:hypothetical protein